MRRLDGFAALGAALVLAGCGGDKSGGTGPCTPAAATQLLKNGADPAPWYFNNPLPAALGVTIKDAANCAVPGVVVNWSIATGGGGLSNSTSTTNASGIATINDSVGGSSIQIVQAMSSGLPSQAFQVQASAPPTTVGVDIKDNFFSPRDTVIQTGGTVTWTWLGSATHNVTFTGGPTPLPGNGGNMTNGGTFHEAITGVGTYSYSCTNHAGMNGTLTVVH